LEPKSHLHRVLSSGQFAVTAEIGPPRSADPEVIRKKARLLKGYVDAVNITDCQTAIVRLSSIASAVLVMSEGLEPVVQMTCRDRNRIAIQADLLGASALGIRNPAVGSDVFKYLRNRSPLRYDHFLLSSTFCLRILLKNPFTFSTKASASSLGT